LIIIGVASSGILHGQGEAYAWEATSRGNLAWRGFLPDAGATIRAEIRPDYRISLNFALKVTHPAFG